MAFPELYFDSASIVIRVRGYYLHQIIYFFLCPITDHAWRCTGFLINKGLITHDDNKNNANVNKNNNNSNGNNDNNNNNNNNN